MQGLIMADTGEPIILLMKKWVDSYCLIVKAKASYDISGANVMAVQIMGTTRISLLLAPTLGIDMDNVTVCSGNF